MVLFSDQRTLWCSLLHRSQFNVWRWVESGKFSHSSQSSFRLVLASHIIFGLPKLSEMTTGLTMPPCTCSKDKKHTVEQICYRRRPMSLARPRLWVGQSSVQDVCDTCFALATRLIYADCKFLSLNSALIYSFIFCHVLIFEFRLIFSWSTKLTLGCASSHWHQSPASCYMLLLAAISSAHAIPCLCRRVVFQTYFFEIFDWNFGSIFEGAPATPQRRREGRRSGVGSGA